MIRLSGLDAGFLYAETKSLHMHTLKVAVVERTNATPGWFSFDEFQRVLGENLHRLPPFRRRLANVPFGIDHPRWVDDGGFELSRHLRHVVADAPGGDRELCKIVSDVAGQQLDRRLPLWQITAVDGLTNDRVAFIAKLHHSMADGTAANELLMNVLDLEGSVRRSEPAPPWEPEAPPTDGELLRDAAREVAARALSLPRLLRRTTQNALALSALVRGTTETGAVPFRTPKTPFNGALTPRRTFATTEVSMDALRDVRRAAQVSLNDVFLAVVAGGLRTYLGRRGVAIDRPLVAGVPASTESREGRLSGNRVSNLFASLPIHVADPRTRLSMIHDGMAIAKARHATMGPDMLASWAEYAPGGPYGAVMRTWSRFGVADRVNAPINLVVSSVPGPKSQLTLGDVRLVSIHSIGPILEGIGLNVTAWSYVDKLLVGLMSCPEHIPDMWQLVEDVDRAADELCRAFAA